MQKTQNILLVAFFIIIILLIINLIIIRFINPRELDDLNPQIACSQKLIEKSDILWIIPNYKDISIPENKEWCEKILLLNKTIGMHGVMHQPYQEFSEDRNQDYLNKGRTSFEFCFGHNPELFKPPQLEITKNNIQLIKNSEMLLKSKFNQLTHKVYHCSDSGKFPNWLINLI